MSLRIQHNIAAFDAERNLDRHDRCDCSSPWPACLRVTASTPPLTTPPASRSARSCVRQIGGLAQANSNAQDGISLVQTAEGQLNEVHSMLQRVRDLAVQYKNGTLEHRRPHGYPVRGQSAGFGDRAHRSGRCLQRHQPARRQRRTITFQIGANDGDTIAVSTISLGSAVNIERVLAERDGHDRHLGDRRCDQRSVLLSARRSARCRTASSTRSTTSRRTRRT